MGLSRVHHCISQEMVAQGLEEPPAKKCNCRKFIAYKQADEMVKKGEARWVVTARERGTQEKICPLCHGDEDVKNCAGCNGNGKHTVAAVWDTYNNDIVLVSRAAVDLKEKKYRPALAMKTPRVATIESEHIERAYVDGNRAAQARIEEYGYLILEARAFVGPAECKHSVETKCTRCGILGKIPAIKSEPADDVKTGEGRKYDWGRAI
jgi:hypothetical protein